MTESREIRSEEAARLEAMQRARAKLDFYKHLTTYTVVIGALCAINLATSTHYLWFLWPAAGWGIGLVAHAINLFGFSERTLQRMTERELRRHPH